LAILFWSKILIVETLPVLYPGKFKAKITLILKSIFLDSKKNREGDTMICHMSRGLL
jgi:hypothetical protein